MSYEIRELTDDGLDDFRHAIASGFGEDVDLDDEMGRERFAAVFDTVGLAIGAHIVGQAAALDLCDTLQYIVIQCVECAR